MSDIVTFRMPDGSEVSNDRQWAAQNMVSAQEELLASRPNTGTVGIHDEDMRAQTGVGVKAPQSGQPGVGEAAVEEDPNKYGATGYRGDTVQLADVKAAREAGNTQSSPGVEAVENPDSNERVAEVREARERALEKAKEAADKLAASGEPEGDQNKPYSEWSGKQLVLEVAKRNSSRSEDAQLDTKGIRKKSELAALLDQDDAAQQS